MGWRRLGPRKNLTSCPGLVDHYTFVDAQVRLTSKGNTQMFIGVYASSGMALHEEAVDSRPGELMTRALAWGVGCARRIAVGLAGGSAGSLGVNKISYLEKK
ncbi:hypothetical protein [Pseudomonas hefeiensis]|uniref:hypothetical protein n=1 Tax=Pseudomonas hefeiensis TaxID=2738125 RepID=UPI003BF5A70C